MEHAEFWRRIDAARASGGAAATLARELAAGPTAEAAAFEAWMRAYLEAVRREDLWAAVYLIRGGCSDDSFDAFRGWLVARGEKVLLAAVHDPESLAAVDDGSLRDERMFALAWDTDARGPSAEIPGCAAWPADRIARGLAWNDAFFRERYPRLWAKYGADRPAPLAGAISRERFWEIVEQTRPAGSVPLTSAHLAALIERLVALPIEEVLGFGAWMSAYNRALMRNDVRAASDRLLGRKDRDAFPALRGWLILQGEAAVSAAVRAPDRIGAHYERPMCLDALLVMMSVGDRRNTYLTPDDTLSVPEAASWPPDAPPSTSAPSAVRSAPATAPAPNPQRVRHPKFGDGTVVSVDGTGDQAKLVIDFESGQKTLLRRFVQPIE